MKRYSSTAPAPALQSELYHKINLLSRGKLMFKRFILWIKALIEALEMPDVLLDAKLKSIKSLRRGRSKKPKKTRRRK